MFDRNSLKRIGDRATQILCVIGFALQNYAARNDRISTFP